MERYSSPFIAFGGLEHYCLQGLLVLEVTELDRNVKNNYKHRIETQKNPNTLLVLKYIPFIILFVAAASLKENQINVVVEGGFS